MNNKYTFFLLLLTILIPFTAYSQNPVYDDVVYVTATGAGEKDGTSWDNAFGDINAAITAAANNGKLPVWIAAGTYYGDGIPDNNAFTVTSGVSIYGGFAGNEPKTYDLSLRDFETNKTILDGQNIQRVLYSGGSYYESSGIDGFTIQHGVTQASGAGVSMSYTTMKNCVVKNNESSNSGGGGVDMSYSNILNSSITDNVCQYRGAGVYAYSGSTISGCLIANNVQNYPGISDAYAGGICAYYDAVIKNCIIKNNSSYNTGGVSLEYGATLENCLVANNTGGAITGGVFMWTESWGGESKLTNCDVVRNDGGGISGSGAIINTIVWGNKKNGTPLDMAGAGITATNSAVGGGCSGTNNVILDVENTGTGFYHPKFANPSTTAGVEATPGSWSWQLTGGSVCANRGTSEGISVPEKDLAGNDRVQQGIIDMGCYESNFTATTIPTFDEIVYVVPNGAGNKTGTSWANATGDINYAIGQARANGLHKVWVAAGTYIGDSVAANNAFTIYNGVSLYGGFAGNEAKDYDLSLRDFDTNKTILDGQNVQRVVYQDIHFSDITYIDGFTIRNGYKSYDQGAGMYLRGKSYVRNCTITNNTTADNYAEGGGIYMNADSDHPSNIENCVINSNTANSYGGGVYMKYTTMTGCPLENNSGYYGGGLYAEYSTVSGVTVSGNSGSYGGGVSLISTSLSNSTITGNTCEYGGGGVYANGSSTITGCEISDNISTSYSSYADYVGGIYASYSEIKNCVIRNNSSNNVGGVSLSGATLDNCLVANNTGTSFAGGVYMSYNSNVINCDVVKNLGCGITANNESWGASNVVNTIVWGNEKDSSQLQMSGSNMVVKNSAITDGWDGTGNIALSDGNSDIFGPHFTSPDSWQLADGSFCINRGTSEGITVPEKDLAGNDRVQQGIIDMGCYESNFTATTIPTFDEIVYVVPNGSGNKTGTSWANATGDIRYAIGQARTNNLHKVWVKAGTYVGDSVAANNAFTLYDGVSFYGGFAGNEPKDYNLASRDFNANKTILDGQKVQRVLYQETHFSDSTYIDGFTITNGRVSGEYGAGLYLKGKSVLRNCVVIGNSTTYGGGGMYVYAASDCRSLIENCTITNNQSSTGGGAYMMYATMKGCMVNGNRAGTAGGVEMDNSILQNCVITQDTCSGEAGGVKANSSTVTGCEISRNVSTVVGNNREYNVGGIYASRTQVTNCVIKNNKSNSTGGVYLSEATLDNCLVANNTGGSYNAGGVYMLTSSTMTNCDVVRNSGGGVYSNPNYSGNNIINTIVWGNERYSSPLEVSGGNITMKNTAVTDGYDGTDNVILDRNNSGSGAFHPKFANPSTTAGVDNTNTAWSWQLGEGSVCVNRGTSEGISVPEKDLAGNDRVKQGTIDIGCYESNHTTSTLPTYSDGIVYVTTTGAGSKDGTSWANAIDDINVAAGIASSCGGLKVWVAAGTYTGDGVADNYMLTLHNGIDIYGGFAGTEPYDFDLTGRDLKNNVTTLDGQNAQGLVNQLTAFADTTYFDGFTLTNAHSSNKVMNLNAKSYVRNCIITKNDVSSYAVSMENSILDNCLVANNNAGLYMHNDSKVINCDIVNNDSYGVSSYYSGSGSIVNSIIWGNRYGQVSGYNVTLTYCAVTGGYEGDGNINLSADNFGADPEANYPGFLNPTTVTGHNFAAGDWSWQLTATSACLDAGTTTGIRPYAIDLAGDERIQNSVIDMGCYEFRQVIENTIYADICDGENYVANGFNIVAPAVGERIYTNVGTSYLGIDSIMHLDLTVHQNYLFEKDSLVCDLASIVWHGRTLTESGTYYDSLTSIYTCDSIYKLNVEFHRKPLGAFSYMSTTLASEGTDTIKNMPVSLLWNSVTNAELYDIYLWDVNDTEPTEPYIPGMSNCYVNLSSALTNHHKYNWYVVARNACHEQTSPVYSFYVKVKPELLVSNSNVDFGEIAMNGNVSTSVAVTGYYLLSDISVDITGVDAAMFSYNKASGWNDMTGGILALGFHPTTPKYNYEANIIVSSGTLSDTIRLRGGVSNLFTFTTVVDETVFSMGSTIPIHGSVVDWESNPAVDIDVEVSVIVMDTRRTIMAHTDANGLYSTTFVPMATESGYYIVNSGREGNTSTAQHDAFNIPGLALLNYDGSKMCLVDQGWSVRDSVLIRNKSNLTMTNIQLTKMSSVEGCTVTAAPLTLGGLDADYLVYTISGSTLTEGIDYQELKLKVSSDEGAEVQFNVWYYCKPAVSDLDMYPSALTTNMTKGKSKIVDVMLVNGGTTETGLIVVDLPDVSWLSVVGNDTLSSIAVNDTAYFSLRLSPASDINLIQYTGTIVLHSERGDDKVLPYTIDAVSESTGTILVDATDEYTYNTNGGHGPHLEGAYVTIKGYYSLATVAQGYTDSDGQFRAEDLPEGWYRVRVSADRHAEYNNTIQVTAGNVIRLDAFMQYQAVTYSWDVVPTEIQDEYTFELIVNFETNVPKPVLTIDNTPTRELEYGETDNFNLIITNHGLITTYEVELTFDDNNEYTFAPLYDIIDSIAAQTTIIVPCQYSRIASRGNRGDDGCSSRAQTKSYFYCNDQRQWAQFSSKNILTVYCGGPDIPYHLPIGFGGGKGPTYSIGGPGMGRERPDAQGDDGTPGTTDESCTPCLVEFMNVFNNMAGCIPFVGQGFATTLNVAKCGLTGMVSAGIGAYKDYHAGSSAKDVVANQLQNVVNTGECLLEAAEWSIPLVGNMNCIMNMSTAAMDLSNSCYKVETKNRNLMIEVPHYWQYNIEQWIMGFRIIANIVVAEGVAQQITQLFSEDVWQEELNMSAFLSDFTDLCKNSLDRKISSFKAENLASTFVGTSITHDDIIAAVARWNRSVDYWDMEIYKKTDVPEGWSDDFMEYDTEVFERADEFRRLSYRLECMWWQMQSIVVGKDGENDHEWNQEDDDNDMSLVDGFTDAYEYLEEFFNNQGESSVCAHVTVKFSQKMTMTREAFEGTFSVHNSSDENSIEDIVLDLVVKDKNTGDDCTNLFQIDVTSLNEITSVEHGSLGAGKDGTAIIQFIPTKNAAPTTPKVYSFGGTFSFIDPYTLEEVVFDLYPVDLTVNPSPDLYVDYFMQRDILGDDALTEDVIEPSVPAELGVRIHNKGAGTAKNVNLETAEPEIVDNEKGLAVDFAMYGASYNGNDAQIGLMNIPFGNIESGRTAVGEWLFTSSLLGHFVSYEAHVIHNSSKGNPELSLVSSLRLHELIHPIRIYGAKDDNINDFLVNDILDAYDNPDTIYFSQGGSTGVGLVTDMTFDDYVTVDDTIVTLTINSSRVGWNYGKCNDPGRDKYELVSCTRDSDGQVIPLQNVWQTFVTLTDMTDPVYENKLHIVDTLSAAKTNVTYTLVYTLKTNLLDVKEIIGIPTDPFITEPLTSFQVKFNEPIIDSTFTYRDMTLWCNAGVNPVNLMNESVTVTKVADSLYNVDITGLTNETGYYVLNVHTMNIKDERGYTGYNGKQATWVQYITSLTQNDTLVAGWNWWSTYIEQSTISGLDSLEKTLGSNGLQIKSHLAFVDNYYPTLGYNYWYGSLTDIDNESSYRLKLVDDGVTTVKGPRSHADEHEITINPEWNWIGYPLDTKRNVNSATDGFTPEANDIMKSHNESSIYYSGYGWYPVINLEPGKGYMYKSNAENNKTLTYNVSRNEDLATPDAPHLLTTNRHAFADNLTVVAAVYLDGERLSDCNMELGAFVNGECRGSAILKHFPPLDCYYAVLTVSGEDGEAINFGLIDRIGGAMNFNSMENMVFEKNAVAGDIENPYEVRFSTASNSLMTFSMYPNPVEKGRTITLDIPETETVTEVIITDIIGTVIRRNTDGSREVKGLTTRGVYDIQVFTASGNIYHGRLIVK
ncbi:MAG: right-handed parallel beta-helix repeat-containing protein [Bacteroidales bacterium]|nr:right-handed parallel beta-helix repeat-containing protein [Bacteroidales bacterium]